jgi:hypothetical protein
MSNDYLIPGEEAQSSAADRRVEEFPAQEAPMSEKYGPDQIELPFDEWVIWRDLPPLGLCLTPDNVIFVGASAARHQGIDQPRQHLSRLPLDHLIKECTI